MKTIDLATLVIAAVPALVMAQATPAPAKPGARPAAVTAPKSATARRLTPEQKKAVETATPVEEPDPRIKLSEAELEIAKRVHTGDIPCELGASVQVTALKREGFFLVTTGRNRFVMHPVESRTGALRLEDPVRGALWLQLGNKSMLMNQKVGQRLADECQSPDQKTVAEELRKNPINLLEPAPKPAPAAASAAAPSAAPASVPGAAPAAVPAPAAAAAAPPAASAPARAASN